jgi:anti-anti-sigma regulatory factor
MTIRQIADGILAVFLPREPELAHELEALNEMVSNRTDVDVIIDFSLVEIVTSSGLSNLITLQSWLHGCGHRLILHNVGFMIRCCLRTAGLTEVLEFAEDKSDALAKLAASVSGDAEDHLM